MRLLLLASLAATLAAQPGKMPTVLYGASYYHEYMPAERLARDVELMKQAGLTVVRVGESTWSSWEPADGRFEFAWMDRVVDAMHKAGIRVIMGTPTYSIPPWLYRKHPEILLRHMDGRPAAYGLRQNMDISHPAYRFYCERVIRQIMARYKDHPAIIGWQLDNETSHYNSAGPLVQQNFNDYLKAKFGSVEKLNQIWGFVYWGQLVGGWDELPPREGIVNPGYKVEWERFQRTRTTDFLAWQAKIVNEYRRPGQFVTQDFPGGVRVQVDQWEIAKSLDVVATNPYYDVQDNLDGHSATFTDDIARSLKGGNFLVTETNAQTQGWDSKGQYPPYDGQLRLNVYSHIADGANMVGYWHWHSLHYGQETYWKGVLSHDLEPNRIYGEFMRVAQELKKYGPRLANFERRNDVALLCSLDSYYGIEFMPFSDKHNYMSILRQFHKALYELNAGVDFVTPDSDYSRYKAVVVPPLYVASDAQLKRLADFAKAGGHVVMTFKSGFTNEYSTVRAEMAPGPLREAAGFHYQEFSTLDKPLALKGDPLGAGAANQVSAWAEMIVPDTAESLAFYDHPFFGKYPALTRNRHGKGTVTFEGAVFSDGLQKRVLLDVLKRAGLAGPDQELPAAVRVKHGYVGGKRLHYYLNYSGVNQQIQYPYSAGTSVLTGEAVEKSRPVTLGPWDLAIVEEN